VLVAHADGSHRIDIGRGSDPAWSSHGRLAFLSSGQLVVGPRALVGRTFIGAADDFAWSPGGSWLGYSFETAGRGSDVYIVHPDGTERRLLGPGVSPSWSADGRFIGYEASDGIHVLDMRTGTVRLLADYERLLWAPTGHTFAAGGRQGGEYAIDAASGARRLLTRDSVRYEASWSPDGRSLAYFVDDYSGAGATAGLRLATVGRGVATLVAAAGDRGGKIDDFVWTRPAATVRYRQAVARSVAQVNGDELVAQWPIARLAADGSRIAYASCGHVFVWTPSSEAVVQADGASLTPLCTPHVPGSIAVPVEIYDLTIAGDRVAFGHLEGNTGQEWWLASATLTTPPTFAMLDVVYGAGGCDVGHGLGELAGSGDLLVYSAWRDVIGASGCRPAQTVDQTIERADPDSCAWSSDPGARRPCPTIATSPGPLVPFDVNDGRIVAGGENATVLFDSNGKQLLSIPVSPLAAQLSGSDVVVLVQGELRDYDASTGALLHAWPLPDVQSGGECGSPHDGAWECRGVQPRLLLEDAARGLVTYVLDGQVHLLRLSDGVDAVVAAGMLARFMDAGLVYADGARLHLVPNNQLPLH